MCFLYQQANNRLKLAVMHIARAAHACRSLALIPLGLCG
jgi:hypothetical protein